MKEIKSNEDTSSKSKIHKNSKQASVS